jgi:hypothetical protein
MSEEAIDDLRERWSGTLYWEEGGFDALEMPGISSSRPS